MSHRLNIPEEWQLRKPVLTLWGSAGRGRLLALQRNPKFSSGVGVGEGRARSAPGEERPGGPVLLTFNNNFHSRGSPGGFSLL